MDSPTVEPLGLLGLESIHWYVDDLEGARRFYTQSLDFAEVGRSSPALELQGKQSSLVFQAGACVVVCSSPLGEGGRAWRYLRKHPEGVGTLNFRVGNAHRLFAQLEQRGATPIDEVQTVQTEEGHLAFFSITTPFGDTTFRFIERQRYGPLFPGLELYPKPKGGRNRYGFTHVDHVTSNFQTMKPALLWLEHVMGFERFLDVQFHTQDAEHVEGAQDHGSGLKSTVMWDRSSGIKFANDEPQRPHFKNSQINIFHEDNRGDGIQHLALAVKDIMSAVEGLRTQGRVEFMPTPGRYYDALPARLQALGIGQLDESIDALRGLEILVDGDRHRSYLLQIFMKEASAGPFFYELIQRKGDHGFGGGNFRALFESIEREQSKEGLK